MPPQNKDTNTRFFSIHLEGLSSTFNAQRNASGSPKYTKAVVCLETENRLYFLPKRKNGMKTAQVHTKQHTSYYKFPLYPKCSEKRNTTNIPFLETLILETKRTITANEVTTLHNIYTILSKGTLPMETIIWQRNP